MPGVLQEVSSVKKPRMLPAGQHLHTGHTSGLVTTAGSITDHTVHDETAVINFNCKNR